MNNPAEDAEFKSRVQKLEGLLRQIETCADPLVKSQALEAVQTLMEFHGAGLASILGHLAQAGEAGEAILNAMAGDDLVSSLLLLYNLHPADTETRVTQAIDKVRPSLQKQNFEVELLDHNNGIVRVRMKAGGHGCQSTAAKMKQSVEEAIYDRAPEVSAIEVVGLAPAGGAAGFVPLEQLLGHNGKAKTKTGEPYEEASTTEAGACSGHQ